MLSHSHYSPLHLSHYDVKEKKYLYRSTAIRLFGSGLIAVFVPALVYKIRGNITDFFVFNLIWAFTRVIFDYFISYKLVNRVGTKIPLLVSLIFLIGFYYSVLHLGENVANMYLAGVFGAIFGSLQWIAFYYDFSSVSKHGGGKKTALFSIIVTLVTSLSPTLGGFLLQNADGNEVFYIASTFVLLSSIPILLSFKKHKYNPAKTYVSLRQVQKRFFKNKFFWIVAVKSVIDFVVANFWPLLIFIVVGSYEKLGIIATVSTLLVMIMTYYVGKLLDKGKEEKIIKLGVLMQIFQWLGLLLTFFLGVISGSLVYFFDTFGKFSSKMLDTSYLKDLMFHMDQRNKLERIVVLEGSYYFFRLIGVLILLVISLLVPERFLIYITLILVLVLVPVFGKIYKLVKREEVRVKN